MDGQVRSGTEVVGGLSLGTGWWVILDKLITHLDQELEVRVIALWCAAHAFLFVFVQQVDTLQVQVRIEDAEG
jgi:hypothetical protein